jgi:hypothetical protein
MTNKERIFCSIVFGCLLALVVPRVDLRPARIDLSARLAEVERWDREVAWCKSEDFEAVYNPWGGFCTTHRTFGPAGITMTIWKEGKMKPFSAYSTPTIKELRFNPGSEPFDQYNEGTGQAYINCVDDVCAPNQYIGPPDR